MILIGFSEELPTCVIHPRGGYDEIQRRHWSPNRTAAKMASEGDDSENNRNSVYLYTGGNAVPKDVTHVRVDESVTIIPDVAFMHCDNLEEVELPDGILIIGRHAFYGCTSLTGISIPSTVKEIGEHAFNSCVELEEVVLPNGLLK